MEDSNRPIGTGDSEPGNDISLPNRVLNNLLEGCQVIDSEYRYRYVNEVVLAHGRTTREKLLGRTMMEAYPGIEETAMFSVLKTCMETRTPRRMENEFTFPDGSLGWFELRFEPVERGVVILSIDITERKRNEEALRRANRALVALSDCNQTLVRAVDERSFMEDVCRIAVEKAGYRMACIGMKLETGSYKISFAATAGHDEGYSAFLKEEENCVEGGEPICRSLLSGKTEIERIISHNDAQTGWQREAAARGFSSCIALPMLVDETVEGALAIYASEADSFDADEQRLLEEMALDLGYGLSTLRAHNRLREISEQRDAIVQAAPAAIFSLDEAGRVRTWNRGARELFGWTEEEVIGRRAPIVPDDKREEHESLRSRILAGEAFSELELERQCKDGNRIWVSVSTSPLFDEDGGITGLMAVVLDISRRRAAERSLKESELRHRHLLANLEDVVFSLGSEGDIEFISDAVERVYGYDPGEVVGMHYSKLVHEEDVPGLEASFASTMDGEVVPHEFRAFDRKGSVHWMRSKSRVRILDGRPVGVDGVLMDITESKRTEANLVAYSERLARLAQLVQDISHTRSVEAIVDIVRQAARALVGADGATFVLRDGDLCHYVDEDAIEPLWKGRRFPMSDCISGWAMIHKQPAVIKDTYEDDRIPHDAYRPTFVRSLVTVPIRRREPIGAIGVYWARPYLAESEDVRILQALADSTSVAMENVRVLGELEESEARTRAIYTHLPHATFVWRFDGKGATLADLNAAAATMLGRETEEVLDSTPEDLFANLPDIEEDLLDCIERRSLIRREVGSALPGSKDPRRLIFTYGFVPPDMVIMHAEDVTAQRQTEAQLQLSQRLEGIGRLAGGVAHDFNNLLTVINSYSSFACEALGEADPVYADIMEIRKAGRRAAALTRQLLAFGRKQVLEPEILVLNGVVGGIESMLRRLLGEDIEIAVRLSDDLGCVEADPGQIEQIVMNLAVNARDAMPAGGKLTIKTQNVDLDEEYAGRHVSVSPGAYVQLSVSDTGYGMDEETREQIFEPFFTTKEEGKGTGLGLATVYGIVKQSGGNIWVYSEPGEGTTFKIYFPRRDAVPTARKKRPEPSQARGTETVLVVEDEDAVRRLTERILKGAGYNVLGAANAGEALLLCEKNAGAIDLLLTDVIMPRMNGRELAERLNRECPGLRVLFMSGYTSNAMAHQGVLDPETPFIAKPFSAMDLTRMVRKVLDHPWS